MAFFALELAPSVILWELSRLPMVLADCAPRSSTTPVLKPLLGIPHLFTGADC